MAIAAMLNEGCVGEIFYSEIFIIVIVISFFLFDFNVTDIFN